MPQFSMGLAWTTPSVATYKSFSTSSFLIVPFKKPGKNEDRLCTVGILAPLTELSPLASLFLESSWLDPFPASVIGF